MTAGDSYLLCGQADPYWLSTINDFAVPDAPILGLPAAYRRIVADGVAALSRGDAGAAQAAAAEAAAQGVPDHGFAEHLAGLAAIRAARIDDAIRHFHAGIAAGPDIAAYRRNLGTALVKAGQFEESIAAFG